MSRWIAQKRRPPVSPPQTSPVFSDRWRWEPAMLPTLAMELSYTPHPAESSCTGRRCRHSGPITMIGYRTVVIMPSLCGDMMYSFAVEPHRAPRGSLAGYISYSHGLVAGRMVAMSGRKLRHRGKSGLHRVDCQVTPGHMRRELRVTDSATESKPPCHWATDAAVRVKGWGKSPPRLR